MEKVIEIFTDGAAKGNPGNGGYGVYLRFGAKIKELSQGYRLTTNNRMELTAAIKALEECNSDSAITLTTSKLITVVLTDPICPGILLFLNTLDGSDEAPIEPGALLNLEP